MNRRHLGLAVAQEIQEQRSGGDPELQAALDLELKAGGISKSASFQARKREALSLVFHPQGKPRTRVSLDRGSCAWRARRRMARIWQGSVSRGLVEPDMVWGDREALEVLNTPGVFLCDEHHATLHPIVLLLGLRSSREYLRASH